MGFLSGGVTVARYRVTSDPTGSFGQTHVETLIENAIGSKTGNIYEEPDVGFLGGAHLLDTDFSLEKNVIGEAMHFGVRIDSCQIPSPIKRAWMHQELAGMMKDSAPESRPNKAQKTEAKEAVEARCAAEADKGNFKKMAETSLLWDAQTDTLMVSTASEKTCDYCLGLMESAFGLEFQKVTSGTLALEWAEETGRNAEMFAITPASFHQHANGGVVWWNGMSDNYDFLGNEFLLWLWWNWETNSNVVALADGSEVSGMFARSLSLDCPDGEHGKESISSESPVTLPEAVLAIRMGKLPRKAGLTLVRNDEKYDFALQAETFALGSARISLADESAVGSRDVQDRIQSVRQLCETVDLLYGVFCEKRIGKSWNSELKKITQWLALETQMKLQKSA
jgi:hypothetical protein